MNKLIAYLFYFTWVFCFNGAHAHGISHERISDLSHQIEHEPKNANLYLKRGRVRLDSEHWHRALQDFKTAESLDKHLHEARYWHAYTLLQLNKFDLAKIKIDQYLNVVPNSPAGYITLAHVYSAQEQWALAADAFDKAIRVDENPSAQTYTERYRVLTSLSPVPAARIELGLLEGVERLGPLSSLVSLLIEHLQAEKQFDKALNAFDLLPKNLQLTPKWKLKKAHILLVSGNDHSAKSLLREIVYEIDQSGKKSNYALLNIKGEAESLLNGI